MRFGGHQTFHLRDSWLYKGINLLKSEGDIFGNVDVAMSALGVGANMVPSIRFWLEAVGFAVHDSKSKLKPSQFANLINRFDPYFERAGTAWMLHYKLASNEDCASTWFWFFNRFGISEFTLDTAQQFLSRYISAAGRKINSNTIERDLHTLIRTYLTSEDDRSETPENSYASPLSVLHLIEKTESGYRLNRPSIESVPVPIFGTILVDFWKNIGEPAEFRFDEALSKDCSPGKVLNLDQETLVGMLDVLVEQYPKTFSYKKSGGFFTLKLKSPDVPLLLKDYYGEAHA